jgi:hypothetical protein
MLNFNYNIKLDGLRKTVKNLGYSERTQPLEYEATVLTVQHLRSAKLCSQANHGDVAGMKFPVVGLSSELS